MQLLLYLLSALLFSIAVSEALFQKSVLHLTAEHLDISSELHGVLNAPCLQIAANPFVCHLFHRNVRQVGLRFSKRLMGAWGVHLLKAKLLKLSFPNAVLVELVEDKVQDFLGGTLACLEDLPKLMRSYYGGGRVSWKRRQLNKVLKSYIKMFLVIVVRTCFDLSFSVWFLWFNFLIHVF